MTEPLVAGRCAKATQYSFCEATNTGLLSSWHIRRLTAKGPQYGVGIDTVDRITKQVERTLSKEAMEAMEAMWKRIK